jgi:hypothetical protein
LAGNPARIGGKRGLDELSAKRGAGRLSLTLDLMVKCLSEKFFQTGILFLKVFLDISFKAS